MNSPCDANLASRPALNESQVRHVLSNFEHADKLLSEIEGILTEASSKAAFPKFVTDVTPAQTRMVESYVARLRTQMLRVLDSIGGRPGRPTIGTLRAIRVHLTFVRIAIEECTPDHLRGYGTVPDELVPELDGLSVEIEGIVSALESALSDERSGRALEQKLSRLPEATVDTPALLRAQEIVTRHGLVEFRPALAEIVDRLASPRFEIALFGQVSCGKSSLLNQMIGQELLPIGVNPITSVPTRIVYAPSAELTVWFADRQIKRFEVADLREFVTEDRNPGNTKAVARIVAGVPSDRLREGIVFVDTPGLGSLAASGAAETKAYLPNCDLGVVLVNSSATLSPEDVATIQALFDAGVRPAVIMSKADLLSPDERAEAATYIERKVEHELGTTLRVFPVSVVTGNRDLLEGWFEEQILPLYGQHRTLAMDSIRRKMAILRESIARALEAKLRLSTVARSDGTESLRLADQKLRAASGAIARVEKNAISVAETVAHLAPTALSLAAERLSEQRRNGNDLAPTIIVREAIAETCRNVAGGIVAQLEHLASDLREAIAQTAASVGIDGPALEEESRSVVVQDVPQIDLTLVHFRTPRRFALNRQINREISQPVSDAVASYSKILQMWTKTTIGQIKNHFEARAEVYRAQLARLLSRATEPAGEPGTMESDIKWLREA